MLFLVTCEQFTNTGKKLTSWNLLIFDDSRKYFFSDFYHCSWKLQRENMLVKSKTYPTGLLGTAFVH